MTKARGLQAIDIKAAKIFWHVIATDEVDFNAITTTPYIEKPL